MQYATKQLRKTCMQDHSLELATSSSETDLKPQLNLNQLRITCKTLDKVSNPPHLKRKSIEPSAISGNRTGTGSLAVMEIHLFFMILFSDSTAPGSLDRLRQIFSPFSLDWINYFRWLGIYEQNKKKVERCHRIKNKRKRLICIDLLWTASSSACSTVSNTGKILKRRLLFQANGISPRLGTPVQWYQPGCNAPIYLVVLE